MHSAGVGRDHAADGRDVAGSEVDAVLPTRVARLTLQARQGRAGLCGDLPGARVDGPDRIEPPDVEDELPVQRHRAADEPGVAALGHDGRSLCIAQTKHGRDLVDRARAHDRGGRTTEPAGPVDDVRGDDIGIGAHVRSPNRVAQRREQTGRDAHRGRCYGCGHTAPRAKIGACPGSDRSADGCS